MAEAFVGVMLKTLYSLIQDEVGLIIGVDKEMKKLASILTTLQAVLEDAEQRQLKSEAIRNWLIKLNDLTREIDDILDECVTHVSKSKYLKSISRSYGLKNLLVRRKLGKQIRDVTEELDAVAAERAKFHLQEMDPETASKIAAAARETGSTLSDEDHVFGREDGKKKIVDILVNEVKDKQQVSILPIVGLGGMGKTTLAQLILKDPRVVEHFETKIWVCVSDDFDQKTLVKAMIESETGIGSASDLLYLDALERRLVDLLKQKRYLLVLDDVWNEDQEKWFKLRNVLTGGLAGSAIITTTRLRKVAEIMGTLPAHNLEGLSEDHCWLLLKHRAFGQGEEDNFPDLEAIGKQIVKKCAGVPLAAKALGGLLRFKRTVKEWDYVRESEIWDVDDDWILPALRLSYHHLPLELRQCFAYCAIFPKDTKIMKEKLIFLWMAHGYIRPKGMLEVEDVGEQMCKQLIERSLFQNVIDYLGSGTPQESVTLHDLVHDLAHTIMENKVPGAQPERIATSASNYKTREVDLPNRYASFPKTIQPDMDISLVLKKYRRLRVLDASTSQDIKWSGTRAMARSGKEKESIKELPSTIGNLNHLRFLNLSGSEIQVLPSSLCSLWNMEVLNLTHCRKLERFPKKMRHLKNLRHLLLNFCDSLIKTPFKVGELTHLKTLDKFIVGTNEGYQLEELEGLNLGGHLEILHLERVGNPMDAKKGILSEKHNLRQLHLEWKGDVAFTLRGKIDEKVLEALQPYPNIEYFSIQGFSGRHFPNWMMTMVKLVQVEMWGCQNLMDLLQLEELPHLESLSLSRLGVEYIVQGGNALSIAFPSVKELNLFSLPNLKAFCKEEAGDAFPNLQSLHISDCPSSVLAQLPKLAKLEQWNCDSNLCLSSVSKLTNLKRLTWSLDENMMCIPRELLECLPSLKELCIRNAHEQCLPIDGLRRLNALQTLEIEESETLTCLPWGWLHHNATLKKLVISRCSEFIELPEEIRYLDSLEEIMLHLLPNMVRLPETIRHLSSLDTLHLRNLHQLTSLPDWLGNLTNLSSLIIFDCPKLEALPSCIQGMQSLRSLRVWLCPNLFRRYEEGKGDDWHKIAHIPSVHILR